MRVIILNEQRQIRLRLKEMGRLAKRVIRLLHLDTRTCCSVTFLSREKMKQLNKRYFHRNRVTDVISLGYRRAQADCAGIYQAYLGDIFICPSVAVSNAKIYETAPVKELRLYLIHGILHLIGYTDTSRAKANRMHAKEKALFMRLA